MNRTAWLGRCYALVALVSIGLAMFAVAGVVSNLADVKDARVAASTSSPTLKPGASKSRWTTPAPALRLGNGQAEAQVGEFFNEKLGSLGLLATSVDMTSLRALGDGLRLAEVTIRAKGKLDAAADVSSWVAVNREVLRLKSISTSPTDAGEAQLTLVVLMVIA